MLHLTTCNQSDATLWALVSFAVCVHWCVLSINRRHLFSNLDAEFCFIENQRAVFFVDSSLCRNSFCTSESHWWRYLHMHKDIVTLFLHCSRAIFGNLVIQGNTQGCCRVYDPARRACTEPDLDSSLVLLLCVAARWHPGAHAGHQVCADCCYHLLVYIWNAMEQEDFQKVHVWDAIFYTLNMLV